jgi:glycosyltransferase involved in cell wall biosynthesis
VATPYVSAGASFTMSCCGYGAADVFVLATAYEGWANVLLEAMACGLPVVTTRVGGNEEVVSSAALGELVEYWDAEAFAAAIERALLRDWDRETIIAYARSNSWDRRIDLLEREFRSLLAEASRRKTLAEREVAERVE